MKTMKKMMVLVLSVLMVLGTTMVTSFAAEPARDKTTETNGSVTVTNPVEGQKYTLYKLFDADMGANDAITYTLPTGKTEADLTYNNKSWFELNANGFVVAKNGTEDEWAKDPDAIAWAKGFGTQVGSAITAGTVKWENLAYGYYYVDTTLGSFVGVDSANKDASISEKNAEPKIDKEITGVAGSTATLGVGDDTTDPGQGTNEKAIAKIGDTVSFKLTVSAKPGAESYVVTDTLSAGLTAPAASGVTVSSGADSCDITVENQVITVTFKKAYLDSITENTDITITYDAVLNEDAVIGAAGNENVAQLKYGHQDSNKSEDKAKVYTGKMTVYKTDNKDVALKGAGFTLYKKNGENWVAVGNEIKGEDLTTFVWNDLGNGDYKVVETTVPDGYNKGDDVTFTIADTSYTDANLIHEATVVNQAGTELPSTGGMGTTILYIIGGVLVAVCGILLVAKKRTSNK